MREPEDLSNTSFGLSRRTDGFPRLRGGGREGSGWIVQWGNQGWQLADGLGGLGFISQLGQGSIWEIVACLELVCASVFSSAKWGIMISPQERHT